MFKFDMPTSLLLIIMAFSLGFLIMLFIRVKYKKTFKGIDFFILFFLLTAIAIALILFRSRLPIFISIICANSILFTGRILLLYGISGFYGIKIKLIYTISALLSFMVCFVIFTYVEPNTTARIIVYASSAAFVHLAIAIIINNNYRKTNDITLMMPINIIYAVYFSVRLMVILFTKESFSNFFDYNYDAFLILLEGLLGLITLVGIYDMISNKFSQEVVEGEKSKNRLLDNIPGFAYRCLYDKDWTMQVVSKAFEDITGYSAVDIIDNKKISYNEIIAKDYQDIIWEGLTQSVSAQETYTVEYQIIKKNGEIIWVWEQAKGVYDDSGKLIAIEGLVSDITKRKNDEVKLAQLTIENKFMEENIRNQQKVESVAVLANGIAHEINNPINGIMNYGQLIVDSLQSNSEIKEYAREIILETSRVSKIVKNLLHFASKDLNKISSLSVEDLILNTLSLVNNVVKNEKIDLEVNIEKHLPNIFCNGQQIQQVLMSLIMNSRDSLNAKDEELFLNKKISITCEKIENKTAGFIRIIVADNGNGIPISVQDKVFDPFFTTKSRAVAMGLGLSISFKIIKNHNGNIFFETQEGEYTRFYLDLPIAKGWAIQ